jgi:hypothetical protein
MKQKKSYVTSPEQLTVNNLFEVIEIISLIESGGKYFPHLKTKNKKISKKEIEEYMSFLHPDSKDFSRRDKTARKIYNRNSKYSRIQGDKKGSEINLPDGFLLKEDPFYKAIFIIAVSKLVMDDSLNLEVFNQFFHQEFPLSFLLFLHHAISKKYIINIEYESDRAETNNFIRELVPVKINFRDGHWILIAYSIPKNYCIQYKIHNIISVDYFSPNQNKSPIAYSKEIKFNLKDFYKNSFGLSVLQDREVRTIEIFVPNEFYKKVIKRRMDGEWVSQKNGYIWKIKTQSTDEVFEYIFRWNGNLKIIGPQSVLKEFKEKLNKFLK